MAFLYLPISWAQPLWWLGVTYCIMPSVEGYGVSVCNSYSYSGLGLGCPCLSSSFAAPVLYWSSNLIKHVSLKMQYPAHQHMGLEHFVLAAPAVSLIRFAACTSVLHLHDRLTLPATGLCKNTSFFSTANQPQLPPTILLALQRTHIPAIHLYDVFRHTLRAKLNTLRCTTAKGGKKSHSTQTANLDSILYTAHQTEQPKHECWLYFCFISHTYSLILFQIHPHKSVHKNRHIQT